MNGTAVYETGDVVGMNGEEPIIETSDAQEKAIARAQLRARSWELEQVIRFASFDKSWSEYGKDEWGNRLFTSSEVFNWAERMELKITTREVSNKLRTMVKKGLLLKEPGGKTYAYNPEYKAVALDFKKSLEAFRPNF